MSLDRIIPDSRGVGDGLHVRTLLGDGNRISVLANFCVLDIKGVAALHAILGNWLAKRDRRKGPRRQADFVNAAFMRWGASARRSIAPPDDLPNGRRTNKPRRKADR